MASGEKDLPVITEISVRNIALIEEATLHLSPGLNAITGETGAGKTLLATSLQLLLGGRARSETVRSGSGRASVEGAFVLPEGSRDEILTSALGDLAAELDPEEELVLRRTISEEGRSRCYIGGVTVPVKSLSVLGERLVSYHSQREQTRLTDPNEQLAILDGFLDEEGARTKDELTTVWRDLREGRARLADVTQNAEARTREAEFLRFQISEIESSGYSLSEMEDLTRERDRLRNVTGLMQSVTSASNLLSSEERGGAVDSVASAATELEGASAHDTNLSALVERLSGASAELEDVLYELRAYADELEADPGRLEVVEDRLASFRELQRKYGEDVEGFLEESRRRLSLVEDSGRTTAELEESIARDEARVASLCAALTGRREAAARTLAEKVRENLADLNLGQTIFEARLESVEAGPSGAERVEFVIRPNPGEPELPVRRYASGGELSRVMLALRLSQEDAEPGATYIFDEVDAGIGGETATAVGMKLRQLGERNQVLTITHLPQIASVADSHIVVTKGESEGRTKTEIRAVEADERKRELARMLSGRIDRASLAHASELLVESR